MGFSTMIRTTESMPCVWHQSRANGLSDKKCNEWTELGNTVLTGGASAASALSYPLHCPVHRTACKGQMPMAKSRGE
eukprot:1026368-Pelagomonas_calceolata.AAC.5